MAEASLLLLPDPLFRRGRPLTGVEKVQKGPKSRLYSRRGADNLFPFIRKLFRLSVCFSVIPPPPKKKRFVHWAAESNSFPLMPQCHGPLSNVIEESGSGHGPTQWTTSRNELEPTAILRRNSPAVVLGDAKAGKRSPGQS